MLCPECGFDSSKDYGKYPTFGAVGKVPAVSALRREWEQKNQSEELGQTDVTVHEEKPKKRSWLTIAACAAMLALGIGIGVGLGGGKPEPAEPKNTVQLQQPPETTTPPETTQPPEETVGSDNWRNNVLRSDPVVDTDGDDDSYDEDPFVFGSEYRRRQIRSVTFLDTLADMPGDAWDVSEAGNGSVMAWVNPNGEYYDLYIAGEGGVSAGASCEDLFRAYENVSSITFGDAFHTGGTEDMHWMFYGCDALVSLVLSSFDTSNVQNMGCMFYWCESLTELTLGDKFVTANADTIWMFKDCPAGADYQHLLH